MARSFRPDIARRKDCQFDFCPGFGGIDACFLLAPFRQTLRIAGGEVAGVMLQVAGRVEGLPVAAPAFDGGEQPLRILPAVSGSTQSIEGGDHERRTARA